MVCEKCGETLEPDAGICKKCGTSAAQSSVETSKSRPRLSWAKTLLAGVAVIAGSLYIGAAIYFLNSGVEEKTVSSKGNSISGTISKPAADAPAATKTNTQADAKLIDKKEPAASSKQSETKSAHEEAVRDLVNKWLASWQSGNMETYRSCYASDFQSKGMNLDVWVSHKTNVRERTKNIRIAIDDVQISADEKNAAAVFTQHYSSSKSKDSGKKKLELKKINNAWKIYREIM